MNSYGSWQTEIAARLDAIERKVGEKLDGITGSPNIRAGAGVIFDLNAGLNVLELWKKIKALEEGVTEIKEILEKAEA